MEFSVREDDVRVIEALLGRSIASDANKFSDYQEINGNDLSDLRRLASGSSINAIVYLLHCLGGKGGLRNASTYIDLVVKNDMSSDYWIEHHYQ